MFQFSLPNMPLFQHIGADEPMSNLLPFPGAHCEQTMPAELEGLLLPLST